MIPAGEALLRSLFGVTLNAVLAWGVLGAMRRFDPGFDRVTVGVVLAAATIVLVVTAGGLLGVLDQPLMLLVFTLAGAVVLRRAGLRAGRDARAAEAERVANLPSATWFGFGFGFGGAWPREVGIAAAIVTATWIPLLAQGLVLPPLAWDALTYHLHFPVLWLQEGTLATAAAPMGDPSNPYFPLAGEMLLYWILVSTGTDLGISLAQAPLAIAGAGIVAWLAARSGAGRPLAAVAGLGWLATPAILRQSVEPMVDVELATWWLLTIFCLARWGDRARGPWLPLAGLSAGLLVGTKYSGLLYAAALVPLGVLVARARGRAAGPRGALRAGEVAAALTLAAAVGGFAYVRNAVNGGNPVLPLELSAAGHTFAPGIVGTDYFFGAGTPRLSWRSLFLSPRALLDAGPVFLPVLLALVPALFSRGERFALRRGLAASALLAFLAGALLMPYREHRYFFPALAAGWAVLASLVGSGERVALRAAVVLLAATAPLTLFYWGKDLVLAGPGPEHAAALLIAAVVAVAFLRRRDLARAAAGIRGALAARGPRSRYAAAAGAIAVLALALGGATLAYAPSRYESWRRHWGSRFEWERREEPRSDFRDMGASWKALARETRGRPSVIAYAGTNTPYPLSGPSLENRVRFVPRDGDAKASVYDWGSTPADARGPGDPSRWIENLDATGVHYLCVYGIASRENPGADFPVEREWADRSPEEFRLLWSADHARIYRREPRAAAPVR